MHSARLLAAATSAVLLLPGAWSVATDAVPKAASPGAFSAPTANRNLTFVRLQGTDGRYLGYGSFFRSGNKVRVSVSAWRGLTPGFHGLHIHSNSDPSNGSGCNFDGDSPFSAVDGHYKGDGQVHSAHDGDLPMLLVGGDGRGFVSTFAQDGLSFDDLSGLAVTIHSGADNYNNIPLGDGDTQYTANSQAAIDATAATGNAGTRVACGVLE